ncbi:MAG: hypothetical protein Q9170_007033 [Blastenia crenularia]
MDEQPKSNQQGHVRSSTHSQSKEAAEAEIAPMVQDFCHRPSIAHFYILLTPTLLK